MLGMPDPRRGKSAEEGISVEDSPFQPRKTSFHTRGQSETNSKTKVQLNAGTSMNVPHLSGTGYEYNPEPEVPNLDDIEDKSKVERKLEERCEKLEEMIRSMQGVNIYGGKDARELSLVSDLDIPPKFKMPDFEKFDGTTCPSVHLTMYCRKMALFLDNEKLLIHYFQDSLVGSAARWYTQLSRTNIRTWRDLSKAFLEQYKHIADMVPGRTALQSMEQKPNESFRQYAQRWRDVAAQVQPPLLESEVTLLFVNTLKDDFYDRMLDHTTKPFADMVMTGELIQAAIKSGRIKVGSEPWKHFKKQDNEVNMTSSYTPGYATGVIIGQSNQAVAPTTSAQSSSKQETRNRGERKERPNFTPIPIRYEELFPQLVEQRLVVPRYIAPIQPPYPPWFNPNVKSDYHAGNPGHHIENCTAFKYVVEQLLKPGMLSFETPEKNPMPNHKSVNAVVEEDIKKVKESLSEVSSPLRWVWKKLVELGILDSTNRTGKTADFCEFHKEDGHVIQECVEFRHLIQEMMNNRELEFFEKRCDRKFEDVCASDESPAWRGFAGPKPLVIKVGTKSANDIVAAPAGLVIKTPAPFPYKDSKQVPWKYEVRVSGLHEAEGNVNEANKTDKNFDDEPVPEYHEPIKESEAEEFLKILKHSEFNVVEQLNKLPARISMLSVLLSSEPHRNTLLKLLNQTFVPKEVSVDMVDRLVGNITMDNFISFSDEEIPAGTRGSHKALHITTRCKGHILPGVLIDNGSALNVLPLATLRKLPIDSTHMKAYQNAVRAFDGTQRDVVGKITIPLLIGPTKYEVDFVVMDIKPAYSCLLGRPWIHAAGAVPSTLHQKLKFVINGKLVTVRAEEDIVATIATDTPYVEMDEDAVECSFRSLELVSATFVEENKIIRRPRLSRCAKMQVRQTLGRGLQISRGFGKQLQGRLYPVFVKGKTDRFGLGYQPGRRERKAAIIKNQERRKARLTGEDLPWDVMTFPPICQSFVSGGLLDPEQMEKGDWPSYNPGQFRDFSETADGDKNGQMDLISCFKGLAINAVTEDDGENPYLGKIGPCPPGLELNNWITKELPVVFKSNTEFPDINGIGDIVPNLQIDFEQNLSAEEFTDCEDEAGCDLPNDLLRMVESEEKQILPHK
ncbi:hypothetical protein V6N11_044429 [Hibiscus sabdariffa]|uniref:Retrotransposon gag domain-containing protein n=1 Tax=Hibiscus sabdariffa TaxID=183260 RepID=A0ABR2RFC3_9ROSI